MEMTKPKRSDYVQKDKDSSLVCLRKLLDSQMSFYGVIMSKFYITLHLQGQHAKKRGMK